MSIVAAKCTQCGADIKIDDTKEAGICEFCGSAFITQKAITNYNTYNNFNGATINIAGVSLENLLKTANDCIDLGEYDKAYEKFERVLEQDPYNSDAYIGKGLCSLLTCNPYNMKNNILISCVNKAIEYKGQKNSDITYDIDEYALEILPKIIGSVKKVYMALSNWWHDPDEHNNEEDAYRESLLTICKICETFKQKFDLNDNLLISDNGKNAYVDLCKIIIDCYYELACLPSYSIALTMLNVKKKSYDYYLKDKEQEESIKKILKYYIDKYHETYAAAQNVKPDFCTDNSIEFIENEINPPKQDNNSVHKTATNIDSTTIGYIVGGIVIGLIFLLIFIL